MALLQWWCWESREAALDGLDPARNGGKMLKILIWLWMALMTALSCSPLEVTGYPEPSFVENADCASVNRQQLDLTEVIISDGSRTATVTAETARTPEEQQQGLMCRQSVPGGTGMVFLFGGPRSGGFWMFNTYAPLDIIFENSGTAIDIIAMEPCPRRGGESETEWRARCSTAAAEYRPAGQYTAAIELPQGWLESRGFSIDNPQDVAVEYSPVSDN